MYKLTTYLYATPSFLEGVARLFDFSGSLNTYNCSRSSRQADFKAIASDWVVVGEELRDSLHTHRDLEKIILGDNLIKEARNELMKDETMRKLFLCRVEQ